MLLKSSSTPLLGSLLSSSFSDSPNNRGYSFYHDTNSINHHPRTNIALYQTGPLNMSSSFSCSSSPISPSISSKGIRRAQSEGNLERLAYGSRSNTGDLRDSSQLEDKKFTGRPTKCLMLQTIPSFSFYDSRGICEDEEEEEEFDILDDDGYEEDREEQEKINPKTMVLTQERVIDTDWDAGVKQERGVVSQYREMFPATGVGLGGGNSSGGGSGSGNSGRGGEFNSGDGDGRDKQSPEEYYKKMVEENPGNPLFLRNYAQFLYQVMPSPPIGEANALTG